jgi:hypothetical protein
MSLHIPLNFVPIIEGPLLHGVRAFPGNAVQYFCLLGFACPDVLGVSPVAAHFFAPHWYNPGNDQNLTRLRKLFSARFLVTTFQPQFSKFDYHLGILITIVESRSQSARFGRNSRTLIAIPARWPQLGNCDPNPTDLLTISGFGSQSGDFGNNPLMVITIGGLWPQFSDFDRNPRRGITISRL